MPDKSDVQRIWNAHQLGEVEAIEQPTRGMVNRCFIVNDTHVIRFDVLGNNDQRYRGEAQAYEALRTNNIPTPQTIALDFSKALVPYDYFIMSKLPGKAVIDSWETLSAHEKQQIAFTAGEYLARIHQIQLPRFGKLYHPQFDDWFGYVADFFTRYADEAFRSKALPEETTDQILSVLHRLKPAFEQITCPALVHGDYHFENIMQHEGEISGIIDFEWSIAGDPSWDFKVEDQWGDTCLGSKGWLYEGYTSIRPLDGDHPRRAAFYNLLMNLDDVVWTKTDPDQMSRHLEAQQELEMSLQRIGALL